MLEVNLKKPLSAREMHEVVMKLKDETLMNGFHKTRNVDEFFQMYWLEILDMLDDALYAYLNNEKLR